MVQTTLKMPLFYKTHERYLELDDSAFSFNTEHFGFLFLANLL